MTRIILIRHGETLWDIEKRGVGYLDIPLSDIGEKQSLAIAEHLNNISFSHLYSSDLGRAIQTAKYISEVCNVDMKIDIDLRETNINNIDHFTQFPLKQKKSTVKNKHNIENKLSVIPSYCETKLQRQNRILNVMNSLAHIHANETIVVVSHSSIIKGFLELVLSVESGCTEKFENNNTAFNSFIKESGTWTLEVWGQLQHLAEV